MLERPRQKYNSKVLVAGWQYNHEALPYDNKNPKSSESHYRTLSASSEMYVPQTTTKEAMEMIQHNQPRLNAIHRSCTNFTTFSILNPSNDTEEEMSITIPISEPISTYNRDYVSHYKTTKPSCCKDMDLSHPLLNRRPKSEFIMAGPAAPGKFMDSHFSQISSNRKCINYFRQMRNFSSIFQY